MIYDSQYWKDSLRKHAEFLNGKLTQRVWRDSSFSKLEQSIMPSCYMVRKLAESKKISEAKYHAPIPMRAFAAKATVEFLNSHKLDRLYQLDCGLDLQKPLSYVANQIIHSYVFVPVFYQAGRLRGVAFNSDRSKNKELYSLELRPLIEAFAECADSYIGRTTVFRVKNGALEVVNRPGFGGGSNS